MTATQTPVIDRINASPEPEVLAPITLDAATYVHADSRHLSRILKTAGLPRANNDRGGHSGFGFYVTESSVSVHTNWLGGSEEERAKILMDQIVAILRERGFVVTGLGTYSRYVFKAEPDHAWYNLHPVYVDAGDGSLVNAHRVPAFVAEQKARADRDQKARKEAQAAAQARQDRRDELIKDLAKQGLAVDRCASYQITIDADAFITWLGREPETD